MEYKDMQPIGLVRLMLTDGVITQDQAAKYFPELADSKDEKIKKEIIALLKYKYELYPKAPRYRNAPQWISWLEAQGEQQLNGTFIDADDVREEFMQEVYRILDADATNDRANQIIDAFDNLPSVVYSNQGLQTPADKVGPEFKVGDWVVCKNGSHRVFQVIERSWPNAKYRDIKGAEIFLNVATLDKQYHLWTIQDAKDGDVLTTEDWVFIFKKMNTNGKPTCYCHYDTELGFRIDTNSYIATGSEIYPATKEQHDLLFQKMHDAGYEWDADKKELKKFEQKPAEWSEEDESHIRYLIECLENCKKGVALTMTTSTSQEYINWLKSLKPQNRWKPGEEQLRALREASVKDFDIDRDSPLYKLYQQLKAL